MANLLTGREEGPPPQLIEDEREFAAEPVDSAWAPGAEADLLAKLAQMPGLDHSTSCSIRSVSSLAG